MNCKLLIFCAGLVLASAASVPNFSPIEDLREAFERAKTMYIPISREEAEYLLPKSSYDRVRRNDQLIETEDAYYVPVSEDEITELRLPRKASENERFNNDKVLMKIITEDEVQQVNPAALIPATSDAKTRAKRQLNIQGGGSPKQGYDIYAQGRAKLWESDNKRNSVHGTAQYSQHLGGAYGNSRPNYGAGLTFTHRF